MRNGFIKVVLLVLSLLILTDFSLAGTDPNWPLKLKPGNTKPLTALNAVSYQFVGYCDPTQGDVTINFGALSFVSPCNQVLGIYKHVADVSAEAATNPISHCVTQAASPEFCALPVANDLAPPGMTFLVTPFPRVTSANVGYYQVQGACSPVGASVSIDIGLVAGVLTTVCGVGNSFSVAGDLSAVLDGVALPVQGHIFDGAVTTTIATSLIEKDATAPTFLGDPYVYEFASASMATGIDWSGISLADAGSGLNDIRISIGTVMGGQNIVPSTSLPVDVALVTRYKVVDGVAGFSLSLQEGELYYTTLTFVDNVGNESLVSVGPWRVPFFKIGTSAENTCGVDTDGAVKCWGRSYHGSMGYGNDNTRTSVVPATVGAMGAELDMGWEQVGSAVRYSCALSVAGGVKCWGDGTYGQLGDGSLTHNYAPNDVIGLSSGVKNLSVGFRHACAVLDSGGIKCWGQNNFRQLGNGITGNLSTPVDVVGIANAVQVSAAAYYTCALLDTAEIKCWGRSNYGQSGSGTTATQSAPVLVSGIGNATYITTGLYHACATLLGGAVKCWGRGTNGQMGDGATSRNLVPNFVTGLTDAIEVEAYYGSTCAINFLGGVKCWGRNGDYELGDGTNVQKTTPVNTTGLVVGALTLSKGDWALSVCVMMADRSLKCWGRNNYYQTAATRSNADVQTPGDVGVFSKQILKVDNGQAYSCALEDDGSGTSGGLRCWGAGSYGRLGTGDTLNSYRMSFVSGLESGVLDFSTGYYHACALVDDGAGAGGVKCWGRNNQGQLGDGTLLEKHVPTDVVGLTSGVVSVAVHLYHSCAITTAGATYCWGYNAQGQLGDGTTVRKLTPVAVSSFGVNTASITTGRYHTCGIKTDGSLHCWGYNVRGQLGDGTTSRKTVPTPVIGMGSGVESVSAGYEETCAVLTTGALKCWGRNVYGAVGDGTTVQRTSPVAVVGMGAGVMSVSAGYRYTCANMIGGGVFCWGQNGTYGKLGDGTTVDKLVPTEIINYSGNAKQLATGKLSSGHTCMLQTDGQVFCWGYYGYFVNGWGSYKTTAPVSYRSPFKPVTTFAQ